MGEVRYSDAELLDELRELAEEMGDSPTLAEFREMSDHSATTYYDRFGSWRAAVRAAGLDDRPPDEKHAETTLTEELRRLADELGETPTAAQMDNHGTFWASNYQATFGSWGDALEAAGFTVPDEGRPVSEAELVEDLESFAEELGRVPRAHEMDADGPHSATVYRERFGSWMKALDAAGLERYHQGTQISEAELIESLRSLAVDLDRRPRPVDMAEEGAHSYDTYRRMFGEWDAALEAAGIDRDLE